MSAYKSREAPVPGSSVSETHPLFWANRIEKENLIQNNWYRQYGHLYYDRKDDSVIGVSGSERPTHGHGMAEQGTPHDRKVTPSEPVAYLRSNVKKEGSHTVVTGARSAQNEASTGVGHISAAYQQPFQPAVSQEVQRSEIYPKYQCWPVPQSSEDQFQCPCISSYGPVYACYQTPEPQHSSVEVSNTACDYSTPGNVQQHHEVKDPVTSYGASFGHRSYQFNCQNSADQTKIHKDLMQNLSHSPDNQQWCKGLHGHNKYKFVGTSSESDGVCCSVLSPKAPQSPSGQLCRSSSLTDLQDDPLRCPKCCRLGYCVCVPRRRQKVPEENGSKAELPPWPLQPWVGPTYSGYRIRTENDNLRLRYKLSRDPSSQTPMNRMYDKIKSKNHYCDGVLCHSGSNCFSCSPCQIAYDARRGTWFNEQLKRGNPFTTTQFKACSYSPDI